MVGMLQIITYLLCVYLVYKGVLIFQIALMSPRDNRTTGIIIGVLMLIISVILAGAFAQWITMMALQVSNQVSQ